MSAPLYPTPTRLKAFGEVQRAEIRWHHFVTPEARNIVTDRVRTAVLREMSAAGIVDIGSAEPGNYSVCRPRPSSATSGRLAATSWTRGSPAPTPHSWTTSPRRSTAAQCSKRSRTRGRVRTPLPRSLDRTGVRHERARREDPGTVAVRGIEEVAAALGVEVGGKDSACTCNGQWTCCACQECAGCSECESGPTTEDGA